MRAGLGGEFLLEACGFQEAGELLLNPAADGGSAPFVGLTFGDDALFQEECAELILIEAAQEVVERVKQVDFRRACRGRLGDDREGDRARARRRQRGGRG